MKAMERPDVRTAIASGIALLAAGVAWLVSRARPARFAPAAAGVAGKAGRAIGRVSSRWQARPGARSRHLRQLGSVPLPNLYDLHPEARKETPREIGLRPVDVDEIAGTAVGGVAQRGADFKPLPAFRSHNWEARWQRIRRAVDNLAILPPIDVVRYPPGGRYWVLDGHNRVAAALDVGQVGIDANVTELVPPGQNPSERPGDLAAVLAGTRSLRAAGQGAPLQSVQDDVVLGVPAADGGPAWPVEPAVDPREPAAERVEPAAERVEPPGDEPDEPAPPTTREPAPEA